MTTSFRCKLCDEKSNSQSADDRHKNHQWSPGTRRRKVIRIITHCELAKEKNIMNEADKIAKDDRAESCHDANNQCKNRKINEPYMGKIVVGLVR